MNPSLHSLLAGSARFCRMHMNYSRWIISAISGCQLLLGIFACLMFREFSAGILLRIAITPAMPLSMLICTAANLMGFRMTLEAGLLAGSLVYIFLEVYLLFYNKPPVATAMLLIFMAGVLLGIFGILFLSHFNPE